MAFVAALFTVYPVASCSNVESTTRGQIEFDSERPALASSKAPPPYSGNDPIVLEAERLHRTGLDLQRNVIVRTCGPTGGVCHNRKEYPDLHTPSNLLAAIDAPCNSQPVEFSAVYDGCESPGDRFKLKDDSPEVEIGYVQYIPGEYIDFEELEQTPSADSPGLHVILAAPVRDGDRTRTWSQAHFVRSFNNAGLIENLAYARYQTRWWLLEGGTHLYGEVRDYQTDRVSELLSVGIRQGDENRNGQFGAQRAAPLKMLTAGSPEKSYLLGRLRGELAGQKIPGTRMPLANEPLSIADMLALFCFIEGIPDVGDRVLDLETPINYENCSYAEDPESLNLLGDGATWKGRVKPLLAANCGGCHGGEQPQGELDLVTDGLYERLLGSSKQVTMPLLTPGNLQQSYLWLKLLSDSSILGRGMPIDPLEGVRTLPQGALTDIETWINNGALPDE